MADRLNNDIKFGSEASYVLSLVDHYRGNPFIEALPGPMKFEELRTQLAYVPQSAKPVVRTQPAEIRKEYLKKIQEVFWAMPHHVKAAEEIMRLLRNSYVNRNPASAKIMNGLITKNMRGHRAVSGGGSTGYLIKGCTGSGKTSFVDRLIACLPDAPIIHRELGGRRAHWPQFPIVRLQCPSNGSFTAVCQGFLKEIDTMFGDSLSSGLSNATRHAVLEKMYSAASLYMVGILIIEDMQDLADTASNRASELLNELTSFMETTGVPIVTVATYRVDRVLASVRVASKLKAGGSIEFPRFKEGDPEWDRAVVLMWSFNVFRTKVELTDVLRKRIYFHTQGVLRFLRELIYHLFMEATQDDKPEEVKIEHLDAVALVCLEKYQGALATLRKLNTRSASAAEYENYEDLIPDPAPDREFISSIRARDAPGAPDNPTKPTVARGRSASISHSLPPQVKREIAKSAATLAASEDPLAEMRAGGLTIIDEFDFE